MESLGYALIQESEQPPFATTEQMNAIAKHSVLGTKEVATASDLQVTMVSELNEVVTILDQTSKEVIETINTFKL